MCTTAPSVIVTVIGYVPAGVGVSRFTVAVPGVVVAVDVAVIVSLVGLGRATGAVYSPVALMVPTVAFPPVTPATAQVTLWFVELATVAVNCCVWAGAPAKFGYRVFTVLGLTLTEAGGELLPPPQATSNPARAKARQSPTILYRRDNPRPATPTNRTPASGRLSGSHSRSSWPNSLCRAPPTAPVNGPAVWTVIVTVVAGDPAVIWAGLNEHVAPAGNPAEHVYVTLVLNVVAGGVGEINMVVVVVCPGLEPAGGVSVAGTVKF